MQDETKKLNDSSEFNTNTDLTLENEDWIDEFDNGVEITPEKFSNIDLVSALEDLNAERDALFFEPEDEIQETTLVPMVTEELLVSFVKEKGITEFIRVVRGAMSRMGYTKSFGGEYFHPKSGKILIF